MTSPTAFLRSHLAAMAYNGQDPPNFLIENEYATEIFKSYSFKELKIQEEGFHRKCALITLGLLTSISFTAGVWLLVAYGMGAWTSSGILFGLSLSMIIWMVLTVHRTLKAEKQFQASFESDLNKTIPLPKAVQAMEKINPEQNQIILREFDQLQLEALTDHVLSAEGTFSSSESLLNALTKAQPQLLLKKIKEPRNNQRAFALALFHHLNLSSCPPNIKSHLFATIGTPQNEEEAELLVKDPASLNSHLLSLRKEEKIDVQRAFLQLLRPEFLSPALQLMIFTPHTSEDAELLRRHFLTLQEFLKNPNQEFSMAMLNLLPEDFYPDLIDVLILNIGGKSYTAEGQKILLRHPQRIQHLVDGGKIKDPQFDSDRLVKHPQELIDAAKNWFYPSTISSIFLQMSLPNKTIFLQKITQSYGDNPNEYLWRRLASLAIETLLYSEPFMTMNDLTPLAMTTDYKNLLIEIGKWPEIVGDFLYVADFGTENSLLKHHIFLSFFLKNMSKEDKEIMFTTAGQALSNHHKLAETYLSWIRDLKMHDCFYQKSPLMASTPQQMAEVAYRLDPKDQEKVKEVIALMTDEQKDIYEKHCRLYFPTFYENQLYQFKNGPFDAIFKDSLEFLIAQPEWVKTHQDLAKKHCELLVASNLFPKLRETLQKQYPDWFDFFKVSLDEETIEIPSTRLKTLGPKFETYIHVEMKEAAEKRISLVSAQSDQEKIDQLTKVAFLQFLAWGTEPDFTQIEIMGLTILSQQNQVFELLDRCNLELEAQINSLDENDPNDRNLLVTFVQYAFVYELFGLSFFCWNSIQSMKQANFDQLILSSPLKEESLKIETNREKKLTPIDLILSARQSAEQGCMVEYSRGKKYVKEVNPPYFTFSEGSCCLTLLEVPNKNRPPQFIHAFLNYLKITSIKGPGLELARLRDSDLFNEKFEFIPTDTD